VKKVAENRRIETVDDLMEVVGKQNEAIFGLGELVRLQDAQIKTQDAQIKDQDTRIKALVALVDYDHQVLSKLAGLPPRPKKDPLAN
jgi:hypothetical protein